MMSTKYEVPHYVIFSVVLTNLSIKAGLVIY